MFWSYHNIVSLLGFLIIYEGPICGLRVIRNTFKNTVKPFMISFIFINVFNLYMGFSPVMHAHNVYLVVIFLDVVTTGAAYKDVSNHLCFLMYSSLLFLHTVWRATHMDLFYALRKYIYWPPLFLLYPAHILLPVYFHDSSRLSLNWPAIVDILDGIHMTEEQLDPAINPVWVQTLICLAVFMCYIPSLYELYHLRFPEQTTGSMKLSKRTVNLIQLASSVLFFVLRVVLCVRDGSDPTEVFKSIVRFYGHYKMWLKLRRRRKIISVEAREISADKASYFNKEKKAFLALRDAIILLMQTFKRNDPEMRKSV